MIETGSKIGASTAQQPLHKNTTNTVSAIVRERQGERGFRATAAGVQENVAHLGQTTVYLSAAVGRLNQNLPLQDVVQDVQDVHIIVQVLDETTLARTRRIHGLHPARWSRVESAYQGWIYPPLKVYSGSSGGNGL